MKKPPLHPQMYIPAALSPPSESSRIAKRLGLPSYVSKGAIYVIFSFLSSFFALYFLHIAQIHLARLDSGSNNGSINTPPMIGVSILFFSALIMFLAHFYSLFSKSKKSEKTSSLRYSSVTSSRPQPMFNV